MASRGGALPGRGPAPADVTVVANGVLFVMTEKTLFAVRAGRKD